MGGDAQGGATDAGRKEALEFMKLEYQACVDLGAKVREQLHRLAIGSLFFNASLGVALGFAAEQILNNTEPTGWLKAIAISIGLFFLMFIAVVFNLGALRTMQHFMIMFNLITKRHKKLHKEIASFLQSQFSCSIESSLSLPMYIERASSRSRGLARALVTDTSALTAVFYLSIMIGWVLFVLTLIGSILLNISDTTPLYK